jgi:hypothetical protein
MASKKELGAAFGVGVLTRSPAARKAALLALRSSARALGPWGIAALLAYEGVVRREEIWDVAQEVAQLAAENLPEGVGTGAFGAPPLPTNLFNPGIGPAPGGPFGFPGMPGVDITPAFALKRGRKIKRTQTKFNKAVGKAYRAVKKQSGKMAPSRAFKKAAKIASRANPVTKSKIGKGKSFAQRTARKIRKSVWGSLRRKK